MNLLNKIKDIFGKIKRWRQLRSIRIAESRWNQKLKGIRPFNKRG